MNKIYKEIPKGWFKYNRPTCPNGYIAIRNPYSRWTTNKCKTGLIKEEDYYKCIDSI